MAEEAKEGAGPTPEVPPSHSMKTDANEMNFLQATKPKYIDDISLYMAWHNWYLAEQNRFLTSFSMFQFSQNQVLLQQLQQTQTAPRVTTANTVHTAHTTNGKFCCAGTHACACNYTCTIFLFIKEPIFSQGLEKMHHDFMSSFDLAHIYQTAFFVFNAENINFGKTLARMRFQNCSPILQKCYSVKPLNTKNC